MVKGRKPDPGRAKRGTGHRQAKSAGAVVPFSGPAANADLPPAAFDPDPGWPEPVQEVFRTAVAELYPRGLRLADLEAIRMLAVAAYRHRAAGAKIEELGLIVQGSSGPITNPMVKVEKDAAATYLRIASEYGLTVGARVRYGLMQLAGQSIVATLNDDLDA